MSVLITVSGLYSERSPQQNETIQPDPLKYMLQLPRGHQNRCMQLLQLSQEDLLVSTIFQKEIQHLERSGIWKG